MHRISKIKQSTRCAGGIRVTRQDIFNINNGDRPSAPNVAFVLTDGASTRDRELTIPEADKARAAGITIFAIGITNQINITELQGIANDPDDHFMFVVEDFDVLVKKSASVLAAFCSETRKFGIHGPSYIGHIIVLINLLFPGMTIYRGAHEEHKFTYHYMPE